MGYGLVAAAHGLHLIVLEMKRSQLDVLEMQHPSRSYPQSSEGGDRLTKTVTPQGGLQFR